MIQYFETYLNDSKSYIVFIIPNPSFLLFFFALSVIIFFGFWVHRIICSVRNWFKSFNNFTTFFYRTTQLLPCTPSFCVSTLFQLRQQTVAGGGRSFNSRCFMVVFMHHRARSLIWTNDNRDCSFVLVYWYLQEHSCTALKQAHSHTDEGP